MIETMKNLPTIVLRFTLALVLNLSVAQRSNANSFTTTGSLIGNRAGHSATLLPNGNVLVVGGFNGTGPGRLTTVELYNPATRTWTASGTLTLGRTTHTAALLPNGKVLA